VTIDFFNSNVLRNRIVIDFRAECLSVGEVRKVAIVGGSLDDHEVFEVKKLFPNSIIDVYGIEPEQIFMDLNLPPIKRSEYDLVLCTNVIEHIWNHENFAKNLIGLVGLEGALWCSFPFNDIYHGAPFYFSAGFHPSYAELLFSRNGGGAIKSKILASRRLYEFIHLLHDWPSEFRYQNPFLGQFMWALGLRSNPRPPVRHLSFRRLIVCAYLNFVPKKFDSDPNYGCAVWVRVLRETNSLKK